MIRKLLNRLGWYQCCFCELWFRERKMIFQEIWNEKKKKGELQGRCIRCFLYKIWREITGRL
jgi:hypothetical protein